MIFSEKQLGESSACLLHLGYYISAPGGSSHPQTAGEHDLIFEVITRGGVYAPDGVTLCGPGAVFAHPPGAQTVSRSPADQHYECLAAKFRVNAPAELAFWPRSFHWQDADGAVLFCREMLFAYHHTRVERGLLGNLILAQLAFRMDEDRRRSQRDQIPPRVSAVLSRMDREYMKDLRIEDLAAAVELSPSHLRARFRETVQMSPHQYLIQQRMRAARHRLVTTSDPVKQIAVEVGFANAEHFCRAFKKHNGTTAATYRRNYRVYGAS